MRRHQEDFFDSQNKWNATGIALCTTVRRRAANPQTNSLDALDVGGGPRESPLYLEMYNEYLLWWPKSIHPSNDGT